MPRNIVEIRPKFGEKTEYYALYEDQININNHEGDVFMLGPYASISELESNLSNEDPSNWVIVTKVKKVRVER